MRLKYIFPILFLLLTVGVFCITASEHDYVTYTEMGSYDSKIMINPKRYNGVL